MKIYNVLWKDRDYDTTAEPFLDFEKAKTWARAKAEEMNDYPEALEEEDIEGWLYCIRYSYEDDHLWITEHEINE